METILNSPLDRSEPLLLRGREVAELIGCSRALAYRLMQRGAIPTIRLPGGKSIRVRGQKFKEQGRWVLPLDQFDPAEYSQRKTEEHTSDAI